MEIPDLQLDGVVCAILGSLHPADFLIEVDIYGSEIVMIYFQMSDV